MTVTVAIPIFRISCRIRIDRAAPWSVVDELIMVSIARSYQSIDELSRASDLPRQLILAAVSRLMKFRLVESKVTESGIAFRASPFGFGAIAGGKPLPLFPKAQYRHARFSIERAAGSFFRTAEIRFKSQQSLEKDRAAGADVRFVEVEGDGPLMSPEANIARLSEIFASGWDEHLGAIVGRGANVIDREYMVVRVIDGEPKGLPDKPRDGLHEIVAKAAAIRRNASIRVAYNEAPPRDQPIYRSCNLDPADILIGGSVQKTVFEKIIDDADRRVIIHSTFLKALDTAPLMECFARACRRGVEITVFWGAEYDEETEERNADEAGKIMELVAANRDMAGRFRINMRTTGSHAKVMLADTKFGDWVAAVGSCNWLKSPFRSTEITIVLRDQAIVGDAMRIMQRIIGRRGLSDSVAEELELARRNLRIGDAPLPPNAKIALLVGEAHDELIREASGKAETRFVVGSHRLGTTARPGAFLPSQIAAKPSVSVTFMYSVVSKPLKSRHARDLALEAAASGVRMVTSGKIPLHGKFLVWDDHDLVITSINWASASSDYDFPEGEVGVHIRANDVGAFCLEKLSVIHPSLLPEPTANQA